MAISKVIYGGKELINLTQDTVTAKTLLVGETAHGADGEPITGTCDFDCYTQDANATKDEILKGRIAYVNKTKVEGAMIDHGAIAGMVYEADSPCVIPRGFHDGSGTVGVDATNLAPSNIRQGIKILGVTGTMTGTESVKAQDVYIAPSIDHEINVVPDTSQGYNYLASVTVYQIPYTEETNPQGGKTVRIG
jgi:hypothetical protein